MKIMVDSEYLEKLQKSLGVDEDGNAVVGKNLEVDGATKLNGGFEPIHVYKFVTDNGNTYYLAVYFERYSEEEQAYCFYGDIRYSEDGEINQQISGYYTLDGEELSSVVGIGANTATYSVNNFIYSKEEGNKATQGEVATIDKVKQYYQHRLVLSGNSNSPHALLNWISTRGIKADSVQDLRLVLDPARGAFTGFNYGAANPATDDEAIPTELCGITITNTLAKIIDQDLNETFITNVSDVVTPL